MSCIEVPFSQAAKLGSLVVHIEEFLSPQGDPFDADAIRGLLADPEVQTFVEALRALALVPVKR